MCAKSLSQDWAVSYLTAVGNDQISEEMIAFLDGAGLTTDHVQRLNDRTIGLYLIQLNEGERSFAYWRSQSAARCLANDAAALSDGDGCGGADLFQRHHARRSCHRKAARRSCRPLLPRARKGPGLPSTPISGRVFGKMPRPCGIALLRLRACVIS
jgi:sugar/nucleoside kinase (ribokinase family)